MEVWGKYLCSFPSSENVLKLPSITYNKKKRTRNGLECVKNKQAAWNLGQGRTQHYRISGNIHLRSFFIPVCPLVISTTQFKSFLTPSAAVCFKTFLNVFLYLILCICVLSVSAHTCHGVWRTTFRHCSLYPPFLKQGLSWIFLALLLIPG